MLDDLVFDGVVTARGDKFRLGSEREGTGEDVAFGRQEHQLSGSSGPSAVTGYAKRANGGPASTSHRGSAAAAARGGDGASTARSR